MSHGLFLPLFIALMMLLTVEALAAPTADAVGIGGAPCGYLNVGHAVAAAADGDTIYLSPGVYNEVLGTIDRDLHFVAATPDCTEVEPDATPLDYVIDGGGAATFHGGMANIATNRTVTFTRVLLQNAGAIRGGLLYVESGATLTLNRVRLGGGHADDVGGIIHVAAGASLFLNGPAPVYAGSAGNAGGALYLEGYAELSGVTIRSSSSLNGAGVAIAGDGHLVATDSWIGVDLLPNVAAHGGGLHMSGASRLELHGDSISVQIRQPWASVAAYSPTATSRYNSMIIVLSTTTALTPLAEAFMPRTGQRSPSMIAARLATRTRCEAIAP